MMTTSHLGVVVQHPKGGVYIHTSIDTLQSKVQGSFLSTLLQTIHRNDYQQQPTSFTSTQPNYHSAGAQPSIEKRRKRYQENDTYIHTAPLRVYGEGFGNVER